MKYAPKITALKHTLSLTFEHLSVAGVETGSCQTDVRDEAHSEVTSSRHDDQRLTGVVVTASPDQVSKNVSTVVKLNTQCHDIYIDVMRTCMYGYVSVRVRVCTST